MELENVEELIIQKLQQQSIENIASQKYNMKINDLRNKIREHVNTFIFICRPSYKLFLDMVFFYKKNHTFKGYIFKDTFKYIIYVFTLK